MTFKKIYRGMENGAETIQENFVKVDEELNNAVSKKENEDIFGLKDFKDGIKSKGRDILTTEFTTTSIVCQIKISQSGSNETVSLRFDRSGNSVVANIERTTKSSFFGADNGQVAVTGGGSVDNKIPIAYRPSQKITMYISKSVNTASQIGFMLYINPDGTIYLTNAASTGSVAISGSTYYFVSDNAPLA